MITLTRGERFERFYLILTVCLGAILIVCGTIGACKIMDDLANEQAAHSGGL